MRDGGPWFVLADLCRVLGLTTPARVAERLDPEGVSKAHILTAGGHQQVTVVNEATVYEVVIRSDKPEAVTFRRWITSEVLPSIRGTGAYGVPRFEVASVEGVRVLVSAVQTALARVDELEPKAASWDAFLGAPGDYDIGDAAKMLASAGVHTGRQRLFEQLARSQWVYRNPGDGRWRAYQYAVENGWLVERPHSHRHPRTGVVVLDAPQVRVTAKGLDRLRARFGEHVVT